MYSQLFYREQNNRKMGMQLSAFYLLPNKKVPAFIDRHSLALLYETKFTFTFKLEITGDFANATFAIRLTSSSEAEVFA